MKDEGSVTLKAFGEQDDVKSQECQKIQARFEVGEFVTFYRSSPSTFTSFTPTRSFRELVMADCDTGSCPPAEDVMDATTFTPPVKASGGVSQTPSVVIEVSRESEQHRSKAVVV
jgi:hypothetical protein